MGSLKNSTIPDEITIKKETVWNRFTKKRTFYCCWCLSDLQTKNYVSANQVGDLLRTWEFWSNFEYAPDKIISKQSTIRLIVIKGVAADLKIVQILSEMTEFLNNVNCEFACD